MGRSHGRGGLAPEFEGLHPPVGILFDKYMHQPFQAGCRTEKEIEQYWGKKLLETMRAEPLAVTANLIRRLAIFFNAREWSQEFDVSAYRAYSWFLSLPWDADSPYHIGRIKIQRGQKEQGLEFLNEALRREPHFPEAMIAIARVELGEGRLAAAERRTRRSLQYNPTEKDALLLLADIRRRQGNQAEEISLLKGVETNTHTSSPSYGKYHFSSPPQWRHNRSESCF